MAGFIGAAPITNAADTFYLWENAACRILCGVGGNHARDTQPNKGKQMTTIEYRLSRIDSWSCRKVKLADLADWLEYYVELGFEVRTAR